MRKTTRGTSRRRTRNSSEAKTFLSAANILSATRLSTHNVALPDLLTRKGSIIGKESMVSLPLA